MNIRLLNRKILEIKGELKAYGVSIKKGKSEFVIPYTQIMYIEDGENKDIVQVKDGLMS